VLFWGILGALVMRGVMIAAGAVLIERFHWIVYVFGAFLVFTGIRMAFQHEAEIDPEHNPVLRLVRRLVPVTPAFREAKFFVREVPPTGGEARLYATPLFVVLVLVETTDLVFAVDSIPAIFGITRDPFLIYTSNVFAILGLRSLFFLLAGVIAKFHYLRFGLAAVLAFVGIKMLVSGVLHIPVGVSLGVIATLLGALDRGVGGVAEGARRGGRRPLAPAGHRGDDGRRARRRVGRAARRQTRKGERPLPRGRGLPVVRRRGFFEAQSKF
jgi:tellurite resistance protein TerC